MEDHEPIGLTLEGWTFTFGPPRCCESVGLSRFIAGENRWPFEEQRRLRTLLLTDVLEWDVFGLAWVRGIHGRWS